MKKLLTLLFLSTLTVSFSQEITVKNKQPLATSIQKQ